MATKDILHQPIVYPETDGRAESFRQRLKSWHSAILSATILVVIVTAAILFRGVV